MRVGLRVLGGVCLLTAVCCFFLNTTCCLPIVFCLDSSLVYDGRIYRRTSMKTCMTEIERHLSKQVAAAAHSSCWVACVRGTATTHPLSPPFLAGCHQSSLALCVSRPSQYFWSPCVDFVFTLRPVVRESSLILLESRVFLFRRPVWFVERPGRF